MRRLLFILTIAALPLTSEIIYSLPVDSTVFQYFPLNAGNRWTWYVTRNFNPGPSYVTLNIYASQLINSHKYFVGRRDEYIIYNSQYTTGNVYYRIDSLTGNLYSYNDQNNTECLIDSLNSKKGDSSLTCSGYRCGNDTGTYNIFSQNFQTKIFNDHFFEGYGRRKYCKNVGRVYLFGQALMSQTTENLRGCIINGVIQGDTNVYLGINQIGTEVPKEFSLPQNYPNPFNPVTSIKFDIPKGGFVKLIIYDVLGNEVQTLVNKQLSAGTYNADFDASALPSGVYYYKLETETFTQTKKMVLVK